jgi:hypothetical protein
MVDLLVLDVIETSWLDASTLLDEMFLRFPFLDVSP